MSKKQNFKWQTYPTTLEITLSKNRLNNLLKRQMLSGWITKKEKRSNFLLFTGDTVLIQRYRG